MTTAQLYQIEWEYLPVVDSVEGSSERGAIGTGEDGKFWAASAWFRNGEFEDWAVEPYEITEEEYNKLEKQL